jgi:hypothetical protein
MQPIEIRQNKKTMIPVLVIIFASLIGMMYYAFVSGNWDKMPIMKLIYVFLSVIILGRLYFSVRKFIKNEPVLTISKSDITINEKRKAVSILWGQIHEWKIEIESDGGTPYLIIKTAEEKKKVNIAWLEKDHEEIEELIITYSGRVPRV